MTKGTSSVPVAVSESVKREKALTATRHHQLADVPHALTWFANIDNLQTRRAYQSDLRKSMIFTRITISDQFRVVTRAHLLAWRRDLEQRSDRRN